MSDLFDLQPAAQAVLASGSLASTGPLGAGQGRRLFNPADQDGVVKGEVAGNALIRGNRSLLVQGDVLGDDRLPCRIEVRGDVVILGAARHAHINARNILIDGEARACRLVAAAEIRVGGDLGAGKAVTGDPQRRQALLEALRAQLSQRSEEHKLLARQVSQAEKRLDRACRITLSPVRFEVGRIIQRGPDRISIDLRSVYQSLGDLPADRRELALNEFFAKGLIGALSRVNQRYLSENPLREKVFMQLLGQLRELFLMVVRCDQAKRELEALERQIDQWVADLYTAERRVCVRGAILPGVRLEFLRPHAEDLGDRYFYFSHTTSVLQVQPGAEQGQLELLCTYRDGAPARLSVPAAQLQGVVIRCREEQFSWERA